MPGSLEWLPISSPASTCWYKPVKPVKVIPPCWRSLRTRNGWKREAAGLVLDLEALYSMSAMLFGWLGKQQDAVKRKSKATISPIMCKNIGTMCCVIATIDSQGAKKTLSPSFNSRCRDLCPPAIEIVRSSHGAGLELGNQRKKTITPEKYVHCSKDHIVKSIIPAHLHLQWTNSELDCICVKENAGADMF